MPPERIHFITGRLAEFALRAELARLAGEIGFSYRIEVLPITVAALMSTDWVARHVAGRVEADRAVLPGYCHGDLAPIAAALGVPVARGPHDLRRLGEFFGQAAQTPADYGQYDIEILAEINHAPRLSLRAILRQAAAYRAAGADLIDLGCDPGDAWPGVGPTVRALVEAGHRVSIDSMNTVEIGAAVRAGAELVLSVNSTNRDAAADWGCAVVAVPDVPATLKGLDETIEHLAAAKVPLRIDPILEPIGCGFAASLGRYLDVRRRYPDAEMLMGIGNLTELTDADSAAINVLLLGICQELSIRSVLTTEVINWSRTSVRECDLARRLVYFAVRHRLPPKRLDAGLVMLRDAVVPEFGEEYLEKLARGIRDHNYRVFAEGEKIHAVTAGGHWAETDPFLLFEQIAAAAEKPIDANHAFYLGYEMAKAATALTLGKDYRQDEALDWGFLTRPETSHRLARGQKTREATAGDEKTGDQPSDGRAGESA
jgi:dihydropteroate synthase